MAKKTEKTVENSVPFIKSINFRLVFTSVGLICIGLALVMVILGVKINKETLADFKNNADSQLSIVENYIKDFYSKLDENINMMATNPTVIKADDTITSYKDTTSENNMTPASNGGIEQEIFGVFDHYAESHPETIYVYAATENGGYVVWPESSINAGYDPTTRGWYQDAVKANGEIIRTAPYIDTATDSLITSNARSLTNSEGKVIGTIGIDVSQAVISDMLSKMKMGNTGFSMIVHDTGIIMADGNNPDNNFKTLEETGVEGIDKILTDKDLAIDFNGESYIGLSRKVEGTDWVLASFMSEKELKASSKNVITSIILVGICVLLAVIVLMGLSIRSVTTPLKKLTSIVDDLSKGNLDSEIDIKSNSEVGQLSNSMNSLVGRLKTYISYIDEISLLLTQIGNGNLDLDFKQAYDGDFKKVKDALIQATDKLNNTLVECNSAADQVANGSDQVSLGAQALSQGSTEQASSIQELSATINEITQQINKTAENARQAKLYSQQSSEATGHSQEQMEQMVTAMDTISKTANEIGNIIKSIDAIAFQTNILALNAAVEAARAGSAGKGFSVVADEVRNLAVKSADSAKSTATLIDNTLTAINEGAEIVGKTAKSLADVVESSQKADAAIEDISNASDKQAESVEQVNVGVEQISQVVQNNSATAEESAAASEELNSQAQMLKNYIKQFKLKKQNDYTVEDTNDSNNTDEE